MEHFLVGCALGFLVVACIATPFVAPWRVRVRYLVNAPAGDPLLGLGPTPRMALREVTVAGVEADRGHVELVVDEQRAGCARHCTLSRDACVPAVVARLDGWSATHTPLLMIVDDLGDTHLYGPDGAVTHLDRTEERTR